jgi:lipoate-protein ligase A
MPCWRLIDTGPLDGPTNMAIDEALLLNFVPSRTLPVFRLYGWLPPAISLGRYQDAAAVLDLERCRALALPVVRRVTGGGVIYHADELTYALVCAPSDLPPATSVKESFRILTAFLLATYAQLGLQAAYAADAAPATATLGERTPFCFAGHETYDILVRGKKLGGNAQRRLKHAVFQHGSIPLANRAATGAALLRHPPAGIVDSTTALRDLGITASAEELNGMLVAALAQTLGVELQRSELTAAERECAAGLLREKYLDAAWNLTGRQPGEDN